MTKDNRESFYEDLEHLSHLHRYFNVFMMVIIIMISSATTTIYLRQEVMLDLPLVLFIPKLSLTCSISFTILLCCFLVENSSTYVFLAMFNCITYAVLNAFAGATMVGVFSKEVMFEFSSEIWYKGEMETNIDGASMILVITLIQVVYALYLAPSFNFYMKTVVTRKTATEMLSFASEGIRDFAHVNENSGKFHDPFAEKAKRNTLRKNMRYSQVFHTLRKSTRQNSDDQKKITQFSKQLADIYVI